ncbi:MAG: rhodanese-like domain-containing protein [Gemmatimonadota bacterium]|nr:rhodanese-like domain-containing protein [Gemmatimonadota bacterium]
MTRRSTTRANPILLALLPAALLLGCGGGEGGEAAEGDTAPEETASAPDTLPASVPALDVEEGVVVITPGRVREWQSEGEEFVLVDARDPVQFAQEHLPGAINVPYVDIRAGGNLPPKDATIVVYCSDVECPISRYAYRSLEALGYSRVYDMRAGLQGWKAEGFPTVIGEEGERTAS